MHRIVPLLLKWYSENKRILPWRENTDAYRIWISEIMLQQTRVEAVKEYYLRFMERFPDVFALAEAREDEILKYWEGLGYYSRARNLHKAAKLICEKHSGVFPSDYSSIRALPGIGEYTAGAISSIAFGYPIPAVDGNVLRVISRISEDSRCIDDPTVKKDITAKLAEIYPSDHCGDFTQSLMELGAIICLPNGVPKCAECPLSGLCLSRKNQTVLSYPVRAEKRSRKIEEKTVLILFCKNRIALRKRTEPGVLKGMWELPNISENLSADELQKKFNAQSVISLEKKKHIFTHIEWHMTCFRIECQEMSPEYQWVTQEQLKAEFALPSAFSKILK